MTTPASTPQTGAEVSTRSRASISPRSGHSERPILFSAPMVRAILEGRKTQTRRIIRGASGAFWDHAGWRPIVSLGRISAWQTTDGKSLMGAGAPLPLCPYGQPGDRLWVRETWRVFGDTSVERSSLSICTGPSDCEFRADFIDKPKELELRVSEWRPSIHMPRWASRLTLEVTSIRVERVQDISEEDAVAEGFAPRKINAHEHMHKMPPEMDTAAEVFLETFYDLNERAPRAQNPWVWVVGFKVVKGGAKGTEPSPPQSRDLSQPKPAGRGSTAPTPSTPAHLDTSTPSGGGA